MPQTAERQPKKGQTFPAEEIKGHFDGCQGSIAVAIPTVDVDYGYYPTSHRIPFYKGNCYTV